ncbi:DNA primase, large subunit [Eremomyces bilateralis CBS 781.70]|uniref:DNA primase large subunit n=1 Tax=Eremomyces bilateralis CBS 781.70 TaxID=1392243 RepID=A0A6G1GBR0_9PEZI|nr:DNA primase, large subunit [Eremomyces bilateralis CBS 781.70]KAF1815454.1 DNA primase, large subunit [Eremomyces bilateralis CBS 781.70]
MIRQDFNRIDAKRRSNLDPKKKQFAQPAFQHHDYQHRLNFYVLPPTAEITLEEFEEWAINRLKVLSELESCTFRNRTPDETASYMAPILSKYLALHSNSSRSSMLQEERKQDHYSHFILRLAFSSTEDLRRRFSRLESMLFRLRWKEDDARERREFVDSLDLRWEKVGDEEKRELASELAAVTYKTRQSDDDGWFKVEWEQVPELVESRRVLLKRGVAYVPAREQMSLVMAEFTRRLDAAMELTARALPRLDEDDRLTPILKHLSASFISPASTYDSNSALPGTLQPHANNIPQLAQHFPACMGQLQTRLARDHHLKHFARLQYTLFLKGIGLSLQDCIVFWRRSFSLMTDEKFEKEYKYNIRHVYGDVGGDSNRRGKGYSAYSCQKILTEPLPSAGQAHGCPYRTFSIDNLLESLRSMGVHDREVLKTIREDVGRQRYHIACNRVFEYQHKAELDGKPGQEIPGLKETIVHPNDYFKKSFLLKHWGDKEVREGADAGGPLKMEE